MSRAREASEGVSLLIFLLKSSDTRYLDPLHFGAFHSTFAISQEREASGEVRKFGAFHSTFAMSQAREASGEVIDR